MKLTPDDLVDAVNRPPDPKPGPYPGALRDLPGPLRHALMTGRWPPSADATRCHHCGDPLDPKTLFVGFAGEFCPDCWHAATNAGVAPSSLRPFTPGSP